MTGVSVDHLMVWFLMERKTAAAAEVKELRRAGHRPS
jgi:hypothetical protein